MELSQRTKQILFALIHNYIGTGDPVASGTVVKKNNLKLSPATVRNILADLDDMGYLTQPHASAGRMPTDLGYRFYVDALIENSDLSKDQTDRIADRYRLSKKKVDLETLLQETSRDLSDASHYIGLVMSPKVSNVTYNHMEFIRMKEGEILVVLVSESGIVHTRRISIDLDLSQEALDALTCFLNQELCGLTLERVRQRFIEKMEADMRRYQELLEKVFVADELSESHLFQSRVYLEGTSKMFDFPDFSDLASMKKVLQAFEEKSILVQILDRSMHVDGVMVYIGSENPLRMLEDCSLVITNYKYKDQVIGTLGVIGPKRMEYSKVIPIVDSTAEQLSKSINF